MTEKETSLKLVPQQQKELIVNTNWKVGTQKTSARIVKDTGIDPKEVNESIDSLLKSGHVLDAGARVIGHVFGHWFTKVKNFEPTKPLESTRGIFKIKKPIVEELKKKEEKLDDRASPNQ